MKYELNKITMKESLLIKLKFTSSKDNPGKD